MNEERIRISRSLSYMLRHAPGRFGLVLEPGGWVAIEPVLRALIDRGFDVDRARLESVVHSCEKQRFELDEVGGADSCGAWAFGRSRPTG